MILPADKIQFMMNLQANLVVAKETLRSLLFRIQEIEDDVQTSEIEKISQIKKIKEEIEIVGTDVANIKKEITLLNTQHVN